MSKLGIFGVGCIGSVLSKYLLANKSSTIYYFNRSPRSEITVHRGDQVFKNKIKIQKPKEFNSPLDWLIICLKDYDYSNAIDDIALLIGANTRLAVFRNGLNLKKDFLPLVRTDYILETIINCPTQKKSNCDFIQLKIPKITVPESTLALEFSKLFGKKPVDFCYSNDFRTEQWKKLIESASLGAIQAVTKKPCVVFRSKEMVQAYKSLVLEGIEVARLEGVELEEYFCDQLLEKLKTYSDEKGSSMLSDVLAGNPLELNAKTGAILKIAKMHGKEIGTTQLYYDLLSSLP